MKKRIDVVGIGPGHPDWLLPVARRILSEADCVIGGRRQLQDLAAVIREARLLEGNYTETAEWIRQESGRRRIAVAVSGDTGFHSLLGYLRRTLPDIGITATPGIGSLQYLFGRLTLSWEDATLLSAHGRELPLGAIGPDKVAGILTDGVMTPPVIADALIQSGRQTCWMAVGERLSYPEERITLAPVTAIGAQSYEPLNAVIVMPASLGEALEKEREQND